MSAHEILSEAARIVGGSRNTTHGEKERSFVVIADLWNAYVQGRKAPLSKMSPRDVAQMMALLKIGRSIQGEPVTDHFLDQAGYSAIAGELAGLEPKSIVDVAAALAKKHVAVPSDGDAAQAMNDFLSR